MKIEGIEQYFNGLSNTTGAVRYKDLAYLLATNDDLAKDNQPHTRVYTFDGGTLGAHDLEWVGASASVCHKPAERLLTLGEAGFIHAIGGGQAAEEPSIKRCHGPMREIRGIAKGRAYAVGTARQAYRRDGVGIWSRIDQTAQTPVADIADHSFESIDGFSEEDIYVVGWEGEVWRFNGSTFRQIESPTNLALYKVRCGQDGFVYACGQVGTLLRGQGDQWSSIDHGATEEDLWGLEWFNGHLYVASTHLLYRLEGDTLTEVDWGEEPPPATCYHLSAADGIMWSIGAKDVMQFDGSAWTRVV